MKNIKKLIRNGQVAVLYSPGFGAGWSTWNQDQPEILFDPAIVEFVEKELWGEMTSYVTLKYPDLYTGGMRDLEIAWLDQGTEFRVVEYDGAESVEVKEELLWTTA